MGLDVYLYKFDDYATTTKLEKEYEQASDANWKQLTDGRKYDDLSDAEKEQARSANLAVAERLGLGQWGALGHFFRNEPMRVRAAIPGVHFGRPCVWAVYEDSDENMRWYEQALEIVIETCDYVLAQGDAQKFWLHWSG